jgi:hypothetical protein
MTWSSGDTPETPCFGAPLLFSDATDGALLIYDRLAIGTVDFRVAELVRKIARVPVHPNSCEFGYAKIGVVDFA